MRRCRKGNTPLAHKNFMFQLSWYQHDGPDKSPVAHSPHLVETPCGAIDGLADKLTVQLLQAPANAKAYH